MVGRDMLEVVPEADSDLLFELVERLVLARLTVEVVEAEADDLCCLVTPQPAGLEGEIAAPIDFLAEVDVVGGER